MSHFDESCRVLDRKMAGLKDVTGVDTSFVPSVTKKRLKKAFHIRTEYCTPGGVLIVGEAYQHGYWCIYIENQHGITTILNGDVRMDTNGTN
jgi:hypothetical protein